jgi:nitroreductase
VFADRPVADADLDRILEAGRRAPSSQNWQPWDFVVVTDRKQLDGLSTVWRGAAHLKTAAAAIALVIPQLDEVAAQMRARYDLGQTTMAMMIAAADLGIGSGHSAVGEQDRARELLGVPDDHIVQYLIDLGYPAERPLKPIRNPDRRPFDEVVHRGRW